MYKTMVVSSLNETTQVITLKILKKTNGLGTKLLIVGFPAASGRGWGRSAGS